MSLEKYRWVVFGILGFAYVFVFFHRLSPAVMAVDIMTDYHAGGTLMGVLASAYFYPYTIMQIPAGLLADSWGPRRSVTFFLILAAVGSVGFGMAPNIVAAIAGRAVVGLGVAMVFVPTMKILTNWFEAKQYVKMTGIMISLGGVGAYAAATPLAMLSEWLTWRGSMIAIGIVTVLVAGLVWLLVRDTPGEKGFDAVQGDFGADKAGPTMPLHQGLSMVLSSRRFWPMAACFFFSAAVSLSFMGLWGGPFLMHVYGMERSQAGQILSMMALGLMIGAPVMSRLPAVMGSCQRMLVANLTLALVTFSMIVFFTGRFPVPLLYVWCFFYSFFGSGSIVAGYTIMKEVFPIQIAGTATGLINIFPFAGAAVGQPLMGWYLDLFGSDQGVYSIAAYRGAFRFCLVSILIAVVCALFVRETRVALEGEVI